MSEEPTQGALGSDPGNEGLPEGYEAEDVKAPFTFKLAIVLLVLYLGWRLVEAIIWVFGRITG